MDPLFFASPRDFRAWLAAHHAVESELWVGFHRRETGRPTLTWPESVDEALCFGWIDGVRKRLDETSYVIRFTPRRTTSTWSAVNVRRMVELIREGRVASAGLAAYERRRDERSGIYSYEQRHAARLDAASERRFREHAAAWRHFQEQPPGYRRLCTWWVVSAKMEETRQRRLGVLIEASARGMAIPAMQRVDKEPGRARTERERKARE